MGRRNDPLAQIAEVSAERDQARAQHDAVVRQLKDANLEIAGLRRSLEHALSGRPDVEVRIGIQPWQVRAELLALAVKHIESGYCEGGAVAVADEMYAWVKPTDAERGKQPDPPVPPGPVD